MKWSHFCLLAAAIWLAPHLETGWAYILGGGAILCGTVLARRGE